MRGATLAGLPSATGRPQIGHAAARLETSRAQSGHGINVTATVQAEGPTVSLRTWSKSAGYANQRVTGR